MPKKNILIALSFFLITGVSWSQNTPIPDNNFEQALIDLGYDSAPLNNFIPTANLVNITNLNVDNKNISDLSGIQDFNNLTVLSCANNNLTAIDITNNIKLKQLFCSFNKIKNIDVSQNIELFILWCESNEITNIDVSNNIELISLISSNNPIENLDVTNNLRLNVLGCENNLLTNLDITRNTDLSSLTCDYNQLTTLNISNNTKLTNITCSNNLVTSLDISLNTNLLNLNASRNKLTELDVTNNFSLKGLLFENNVIDNIDITNNGNLVEFRGSSNLLETLDTSNNLELSHITCNFNNIKELDISNNNKLEILGCSNNLLCRINAKNNNNTLITNFNAFNNPNLTCIIVDDVNYSNTNWTNKDVNATFYNSFTDCDNSEPTIIPDVDNLNDFIGPSYTLPTLTNGNYFTASGGNGINLNANDIISTSQTIYIYSETTCASNESNFSVLISENPYFIPKYFTPNNDGNHDYWKVLDTTNTINTIYIFDRFGKLLKHLNINSEGWDGTFNGEFLPNSDYWYTITFNSGDILRGHFTLKR